MTGDWLKKSLASSRKLLDELPPEKKVALDNDAEFQRAVRLIEQEIITDEQINLTDEQIEWLIARRSPLTPEQK